MENYWPLITTGIALATGAILYGFKKWVKLDNDGPMNAKVAKDYSDYYTDCHSNGETTSKRKERNDNSSALAGVYYNIATDFYIFGWGRLFHFAPRAPGESVDDSLRRYEYYLSAQIGLKPGMKVLDVGCGIGGPMQNIARFSGADVVGLNISDYQIQIGNAMIKKNNMDKQCSFQKGDFMKMPLKDGSFDAVYAVEATCHAGDRTGCYAECFRVLKPGGLFGMYEWAMTDKFDPKNPEHTKIKKQILQGDGLPDVLTTAEISNCMEKAGFEIVRADDITTNEDVMRQFPIPWYAPFNSLLSLKGLGASSLGKYVVYSLLTVFESLGIVAKGSTLTHKMLIEASKGLARGGSTKIFTPSYLVVGRKPETASSPSQAS